LGLSDCQDRFLAAKIENT